MFKIDHADCTEKYTIPGSLFNHAQIFLFTNFSRIAIAMMTYIILRSYHAILKKAMNKQTPRPSTSTKATHATSNNNPEPIRDQITPKTDRMLDSLLLSVVIDRRTNTPHSPTRTLTTGKWYFGESCKGIFSALATGPHMGGCTSLFARIGVT